MQKFEFRAYIHQGRLKPGSDSTALCDAFVRVVLGGWSKDTQVCEIELLYHIFILYCTDNSYKNYDCGL